MNLVIGIDPGMSGAICFLYDDDLANFFDMPVVKVGKKSWYDAHCIRQILDASPDLVAIERQQAMPASLHGRPQGGVSTFQVGRGFGLLEGIAAGLQLPYEFVAPVSWKKGMMPDSAKDKGASIVVAKRLFPKSADNLTRKKDHARADALLIAAFARRRQLAVM